MYLLLAKLILVAVILGGAYYGAEHWCNSACKAQEGRADELQAAANAQKARDVAAAVVADDFQKRAWDHREVVFTALLNQRTAERDAALASRNISNDLVIELRNTISAFNGQSPGKPAEDPAAITELDTRNWFAKVAGQYAECVDTVKGWIAWDDKRTGG